MSSQREVRWAAAAAAVTAIVWLGALASPYHYDDFVTPLEDPASQSLGALADHLITTLRPLTKLTYALESSLGLTCAAARQGVDIAFLAGAAGVLVLLLAALCVPVRTAAVCGALWGVHPVHAESVIAVAGRSEALSGLLVLGAVLAYVHRRQRAAGLVLGLAVLARETARAAIIAIVAAELIGEPVPWRERARRLGPSLLAFVVPATWIVATPRVRELASYSYAGMRVHESLLAQLAAVPVGVTLYVRPWALSLDHAAPPAPALVVVAIGLYAAVLAAGLAATSAFAAATWARARVYRSDLLLWGDAASKAREHVRPHMMYAVFLHRGNRDDDARRVLERARAIDPDDPQVRAALSDLANHEEAR